jgi:hypothetical protein
MKSILGGVITESYANESGGPSKGKVNSEV